MHRQLVNIVEWDDEKYESVMQAMPQDPYRHARVAVAGNFPVPTLMSPNQTYAATPWRTQSCALCSSELDCRMEDEYCGSDGCCHKGECVQDDDCAQQDALNQYYRVDSYDSFGANINPQNPQNDLTLTKTLCDVNPLCVGYNSYGYLKHTIPPPQLWMPQPPVQGVVPWSLYIKKSATQGKAPKVQLPYGIKQYCTQTHPPTTRFATPTGLCRQCIGCERDSDCPDAAVCSSPPGCCVNNPCFTATPEDGRWVDGGYSREPQCECAPDQPYCCLQDAANLHSATCSATPCEQQDRVRACAYVCEDPNKKFDAVMCKANQRCCTGKEGPPVCCAPTTDCDAGATNACTPQPVPLTECADKRGAPYSSVFCAPSEICCNANKAPPSCCNNPELGCYTGSGMNGCNYSDLIGSQMSL